MSTIDIFYRRDMIMESLDLDLLPLTEGIGSNIANAFNRIRKAISNFFKNLIDRIKNLFKKKYSTEKLMEKEDLLYKLESNDIKINPPYNEVAQLEDGLNYQAYILQDFPKEIEKFENLPFDLYKQNVYTTLSITSIEELKQKIKDKFFTKRKISRVNDIDFDVLYDYINSQKNILGTLQRSKDEIMEDLKDVEQNVISLADGEIDIRDMVEKAKFMYNIQLEVINISIKNVKNIVDFAYNFIIKIGKMVE